MAYKESTHLTVLSLRRVESARLLDRRFRSREVNCKKQVDKKQKKLNLILN